jgi:thiamine kinase-like enzyme
VSAARHDLPPPVHAALDAFDAGRIALAAGARAEALAGGLTNRTWRVTAPGIDWVVRIGAGRDAALAIDRRGELVALGAAGPAGLAPAIVHGDAARGVCVLQYRRGATWTRDQARDADGLRRIGQRIGELHALPVPSALPVLDVATTLEQYLAAPPTGGGPIPRAVLAARVRDALASYSPAARAFCHHDLHHMNVVDDGTLTFVDWEYAAAGDPWLDVAAWASYHDLDIDARRALVIAYDRGSVARDAESLAAACTTLDRACAVFDCLDALWYDAAAAWPRIDSRHRSALMRRLGGGPA